MRAAALRLQPRLQVALGAVDLRRVARYAGIRDQFLEQLRLGSKAAPPNRTAVPKTIILIVISNLSPTCVMCTE